MTNPTISGLYCAEVYFGWKLLEWHEGAWWHQGLRSRWTAGEPIQFIGPMPKLSTDMEFDL
jgi:hypothetical protein